MSAMFSCPPVPASSARRLAGPALGEALRECRLHTLDLVADLSDEQWLPPYRTGINPVAWELAHLAWFGEFWMLRGPHRVDEQGLIHAARPARIAGPDSLFDSARLAHARRWQQPLPARAQVLDMLAAQLDACLQALPGTDSDEALYFHRLALLHEDMHGEALVWMRAALGYPAPASLRLQPQVAAGQIRLPGGEMLLGWPVERQGFAFDNELPGSRAQLSAFDIDAGVVSSGQFLQFVLAGGYQEASLWSAEAQGGWGGNRPSHPARWRRSTEGEWQQRWFGQWIALDPDLPVIHVNAFEAQAYCEWAGRRLPHAAEWEHAAASSDGFRWGNSVWEWTADAFAPYAGFAPGPYKDYSQPWFGNHRELRGGSFAAHRHMHELRYRNFFTPERHDIFAGFRTAAGR